MKPDHESTINGPKPKPTMNKKDSAEDNGKIFKRYYHY